MAEKDIKPNGAEQQSESLDKSSKKRTLAKVTKLFWIALGILIFLLILSIVALSTRMYEYVKLTDEGRELSIKADSVENFEIFSDKYLDDNGNPYIQSHDGDPVIAPGAKMDWYSIRIKNDDKVAIDYSFTPEVKIKSDKELPLEVKFISPDEEYLVGSKSEWGTFEDFEDIKDYTSTLPKGEVDEYVLQWRWLYERGDDEGDTELGNAPEGSIGISVSMALRAEQNLSAEANGGVFKVGVEEMLWILIFFILLLIAIVLLILSLIRRKEQAPEPTVVYVPEPKPEPEPVVIAPIVPKKKDKGFVGKMEFVNVDTLMDNFNTGDTVTLKILKDKGLVNPKANQVKILARGDAALNKALHVETQGISAQARQKIIAAGGTVKIIDG